MPLVTIEGIDGSGTTTVTDALGERFDCVTTTEPSDHWTGAQVRRAISDESDTVAPTDFFLFMADRAHHVAHTIEPVLDDGDLVISDRYADSTRAYQQIALRQWGIPEANVRPYIEQVMGPFEREPDLTILLDVPVAEASDRADGDDEKFEQEELFQAQAQLNYHELWNERDRIVKVDASQSEERVIESCEAIISERLMTDDGE